MDESRGPGETPHSRASLPILFSIIVIDLVGFGIVIPILPFYAESYGASATVLGLLLTAYAALQFVFAPIWGRLSDRIGRRPVMLMTIAGTSLALLTLGLAGSLLWLFVARILGGIFGANISVATAYITDITAEEERTRWMGMVGASFGVGFVLGPAIGGLLAPWGYAVPMLAGAALAAANLVYASLVLAEPQRHTERETVRVSRAGVLRDPLVRWLCLGNLAFSLAVTQLETVFAYFMLHRFGFDAREVAFILVGMAVVMGGIQGGAMGRLAARFGERTLLIAGSVLLGGAFAAVPWAGSVGLLLVPLGVAAVGRAISQPSLLSMVSLTATASNRGAVLGAFQSSASLARVAGPVVAGVLYDGSMSAPFLLASALMAGVLAVGITLPTPAIRAAEPSVGSGG